MSLRAGCVAQCRGCAHRLMSAEQSEEQKTEWLQSRLNPWAETFQSLRAVEGEARWHYRDRVVLAAEWSEVQGWRFGMVVRDELLPLQECPIHSERVARMLALLREILPSGGRSFPLAYYAQSGGQATLIVKMAEPPATKWLTEEAKVRLAETGIEGLWLHAFPSAGRRLFSKHGWRLLWGSEHSYDPQGLRYGPTAFQQLIPALYIAAQDQAQQFLAPDAGSSVVDLYCGNGATLRRWCEAGAETIGVELGGDALACARENASGAELLRGTCETRLPQLRQWLGRVAPERTCLLYTNPPRTGMEEAVCRWVADELMPTRIAYLSCSAGTLRRDLDRLFEAGYRVVAITPYDFFPQTYHVETLVLLER
ncbi:hypothetical protein BOW53_08705 [Solemya pervernicosa gill symbiont]|uniref:Class I SAM-dependent RNA methyltransferase n=1 Tax=Solemya pervernicosa gill symbiont TaxID=642797 RepID=A0A1T2L542_9GAMM|nr:class I SAM-dependent RNA methyltransferase [Solemya pervernicosa gill symbiont]OOZ40184.1 hypothetical protein BOW53_08705 [Solemya pervernicosa gill symbiont]